MLPHSLPAAAQRPSYSHTGAFDFICSLPGIIEPLPCARYSSKQSIPPAPRSTHSAYALPRSRRSVRSPVARLRLAVGPGAWVMEASYSAEELRPKSPRSLNRLLAPPPRRGFCEDRGAVSVAEGAYWEGDVWDATGSFLKFSFLFLKLPSLHLLWAAPEGKSRPFHAAPPGGGRRQRCWALNHRLE